MQNRIPSPTADPQKYQAVFDFLRAFEEELHSGPLLNANDSRKGKETAFAYWITRNLWDATYKKEAIAPWDIPKPQPAFLKLFEKQEIRQNSTLIDLGCGSGENALFFASQGLSVTGIDLSSTAISLAKKKSKERKIEAEFRVGDALLNLQMPSEFDYVLDSCLFHTFDEQQRRVYTSQIRRLLKKNGVIFLLCFSIKEPDWDRQHPFWPGPRRISKDEIIENFSEDFKINYIRDAYVETSFGKPKAYLASIEKMR